MTTPAPDRDRPPSPPSVDQPPAPERSSWSRLVRSARPRATKANVLATVLALLLGFAVATQVNHTRNQPLQSLRQPELVGILDGLNANATKLDDEARALQATRDQLVSGSANDEAALTAAQERLDALGILAGTVAATGPGILMTISDPQRKVTPPALLDALEELRDAGAESVQFGPVRVVASSSFAASAAGVAVDGVSLSSPYRIRAIGDAQTLSSAMAIPGGITETVRQLGASITVTQQDAVTIDALHRPRPARYARPVPASGS